MKLMWETFDLHYTFTQRMVHYKIGMFGAYSEPFRQSGFTNRPYAQKIHEIQIHVLHDSHISQKRDSVRGVFAPFTFLYPRGHSPCSLSTLNRGSEDIFIHNLTKCVPGPLICAMWACDYTADPIISAHFCWRKTVGHNIFRLPNSKNCWETNIVGPTKDVKVAPTNGWKVRPTPPTVFNCF